MSTILCVDDDPAVLAVLARILRRDGLEIRTTESPTDALAWIANDDIAVLVSDYDMPEMTGAQLAGQAKRLRPETVRVLLTGQKDLATAVEGINQGEVFRFVSKPFENAKLREVVAAALERHHELAELAGYRAGRERTRELRIAVEQDYPGITKVDRDEHGRYVVADPGDVARAMELGGVVRLFENRD
jgi:DNA-binding NtrC family response regulator